MTGRFVNTIIFVSNLDKSRVFCRDILGAKVERDLDNIVFFENHLVLHDAKSILNTLFEGNSTETLGSSGISTILIYFECTTLDGLEKMYANVKKQRGDDSWNRKTTVGSICFSVL